MRYEKNWAGELGNSKGLDVNTPLFLACVRVIGIRESEWKDSRPMSVFPPMALHLIY